MNSTVSKFINRLSAVIFGDRWMALRLISVIKFNPGITH